MNDKEEIKKKIEEETATITFLESAWPRYFPEDRYGPKNTAWHQHGTAIRDAYWRRRNLLAELESLKEEGK